MDPIQSFKAEVKRNITAQGADKDIQALSRIWSRETNHYGYTYNFTWLGRPIIQYPQDMVGMQELIWLVRPDLIIETGIAHGGSLIFSASMLALLDMADAIEAGTTMNPAESKRRVLGIDIDIRAHNLAEIRKHPMQSRIEMIEGSSVAPEVVARVRETASQYKRVLVSLDSNHTHEHVLAELEAYAPLVSSGSYCVVFDTLIEDMPDELFQNRPWNKTDNPKTAVHQFLKQLKQGQTLASDGTTLGMEIDKDMEHKLLITVAPDGFLRRIG